MQIAPTKINMIEDYISLSRDEVQYTNIHRLVIRIVARGEHFRALLYFQPPYS